MIDRTSKARQLRARSTTPEARLWDRLRNRSLVGWKFRRQHPVGNHVVDRAIVEGRLAIEIDGESHFVADGHARDAVRTGALERLGWRVLRVTTTDVRENLEGVLQMISDTLGPAPAPRHRAPPSPGTLRVPTSPPASRAGEVRSGTAPSSRLVPAARKIDLRSRPDHENDRGCEASQP
jgi:very-short-patch-repair endonuclease